MSGGNGCAPWIVRSLSGLSPYFPFVRFLLISTAAAALHYTEAAMPKTKVALTLEAGLVERVDKMVAQQRFRNRSEAVEAALAEKLQRIARTRLAAECARLNPKEEKALAEEGLAGTLETCPEY
jgi:Arc/MetJ-type ribon-helix-helix transcriptional regulator